MMRRKREILVFLILWMQWTALTLNAQKVYETNVDLWVENTLKNLSLDEKIGQLFMIRAHSDLGADHIKNIESQIKDYHVGGLCFFQGTPTKQAELTNKYQRQSKLPLMIAIDGEWGLGMRHKSSSISFPRQLTLGAISDNTLIYEMGKRIAAQLNRIGTHVNFAPVVDVNINPNNPVIHTRSFGEDVFNVATKSFAYSKGMQDYDVMACAKHFPGHGDTDVDSHYDLPIINHSRERLDSIELTPFRVLSELGIASVMSAHLNVPAIDDSPNKPTSLSSKAINGILRNQMHFEGLVFTDALEMKGVANHYSPGIMEVEALLAGNDILLLPLEIDKAFKAIKQAVESNQFTLDQLDSKVKRILKAKYKYVVRKDNNIRNLSEISHDINNAEDLAFKSKLYQKAITLVKNEDQVIPIKTINEKNVASIAIGASQLTELQKSLEQFGLKKQLALAKSALSSNKIDNLLKDLANYETVILSLYDMSSKRSKDFGISKETFDLIYKLNSTKKLILIINGSPYALNFFSELSNIMVGYEEDELMQKMIAHALMGVHKIEGTLPVSAHEEFPVNTGIISPSISRLGYSDPELLGISKDSLLKIDTIVDEMIKSGAAPGCQILAAKDGKIFFHKSYGTHTPNGRTKVKNDDVYDVASVTKILASTLSLMHLYDNKKINLYDPIKKYLPHLDTTNKGGLIIEDILAHHSGLPGWIAFYENTLDEESKSLKRIEDYYKTIKTDGYSLKVTDKLFLRDDWQDSIYNMVYNCDLRDTRDYRYSDLGFYIFHKLIQELTNKSLDIFTEEVFYKPLGLSNTTFNPLDKISKDKIPPTEKDDYFRGEVIQGHVHDMGAAMLGGVSGHAGLFSNSKELAELMQMLLNGGYYCGQRFFSAHTVDKFTQRYYKSTRRGLGFDMKELDEDKKPNMAEEASSKTFGHLGFTGIAVFADPKYDLIYIFLSNRTYPTMKNYKFAKNNYRPKIQSVFYNAIKKDYKNQ